MAVDVDKVVQGLGSGIDASETVMGSFALNLLRRLGVWEVRSGFGQLCQFDTTLTRGQTRTDPVANFTPVTTGYRLHLGSYAIRTDFGHLQVVSVFVGNVFTGTADQRGVWMDVFCVSIFDVTTGTRWEEVLNRHTSGNNADATSVMDWRGTYESNIQDDFQAFLAGRDTARVAFCEYRDNLLFGTPDMGLWCYVPAEFGATRTQQIDSVAGRDFPCPYAESSRVLPISARSGIFLNNYSYLPSAMYPSPVDVASIRGRVAVASGRDVYFSDIGRPGSVIALNIVPVPSEGLITGIAEQFGNLLIFTASETWLFRPAVNTVVSGGELTRISDAIGCIGPQAKCKAAEVLCWADARGVYASSGQYDAQELSASIRRLFLESLPNPLSSFFQSQQVGYTGTEADRMRVQWTWKNFDRVSLCYDVATESLLVSHPEETAALCYGTREKQWSLWTFESMVTSSSATVGVQRNILEPVLLAKDGEVFLVGSTETYTPDDKEVPGGVPLAVPVPVVVSQNTPSRSYYLLQWGRGGACDRSVEVQEDNRLFGGRWGEWSITNFEALSQSQSVYILGRPIPMPAGYRLPQGTIVQTAGILLPVILAPDPAFTVQQPDDLDLIFNYDNLHWTPVCVGATARIDAVVPPARLPSAGGWGLVVPIAGTSEVQVYDATTGVVNAAGDQIRCRWDGITGPAFDNQPRMNLPNLGAFTLLYLPMVPVNSATTMGLGIERVLAEQYRGGAGLAQLPLRYWRHPNIINRHTEDDVAQPVDWAYKTAQFGDGEQLRLRTLWLRAISHGVGTVQLRPNWLFGLVNAVNSSDWKDWAAQTSDFSTFQNLLTTKNPLRERFQNATTLAMARLVFGAAGPGIWGESGTPATGNTLVADDAVDDVAVSDRVRGGTVSSLLFGHMQNRAERLALVSLEVGLQFLGGRRRRGR